MRSFWFLFLSLAFFCCYTVSECFLWQSSALRVCISDVHAYNSFVSIGSCVASCSRQSHRVFGSRPTWRHRFCNMCPKKRLFLFFLFIILMCLDKAISQTKNGLCTIGKARFFLKTNNVFRKCVQAASQRRKGLQHENGKQKIAIIWKLDWIIGVFGCGTDGMPSTCYNCAQHRIRTKTRRCVFHKY